MARNGNVGIMGLLMVGFTSLVASSKSSPAHQPRGHVAGTVSRLNSRRAALHNCLRLPVVGLVANPAFAFENRLQVPIERYPKTPGPQPKDLGLRPDGSLKGCDFVKPNCFSTSPNPDDIEGELYKSYMVAPFKYSKSREEAFEDVMKVIKEYKVGQDGIDGGGFKIVTQDAKSGYIYVQFESLKKGYIDDFEVAVREDGVVGVRTASRLGFLDIGVNAKRLNYVADELSKLPGWRTSKVSPKTHANYFAQNGPYMK